MDGIVRRLDDRGRVVLPPSIRNPLRLGDKDYVMAWINDSGNIEIRKATTDEQSEYFSELELRQLHKDFNFRKEVMKFGGIKVPSDYEYLPQWCKRKNGVPIDEMVEYLKGSGFFFDDADELWNYLIEH